MTALTLPFPHMVFIHNFDGFTDEFSPWLKENIHGRYWLLDLHLGARLADFDYGSFDTGFETVTMTGRTLIFAFEDAADATSMTMTWGGQ